MITIISPDTAYVLDRYYSVERNVNGDKINMGRWILLENHLGSSKVPCSKSAQFYLNMSFCRFTAENPSINELLFYLPSPYSLLPTVLHYRGSLRVSSLLHPRP